MKNAIIAALVAALVMMIAAPAFGQSDGRVGGQGSYDNIEDPLRSPDQGTVDHMVDQVEKVDDPLRTPVQSEVATPQAQQSSPAAAQAAAQDPWVSRADIEKHVKDLDVKGGKNGYGVCYTAPSGKKKAVTLRYNSASEKARIQRWIREDFDRLLREKHPILETLPRIFEDLRSEVRKVRSRVDALENRVDKTDGRLDTVEATANSAKATADEALGIASARAISTNEIEVGVNWWTVWFTALTIAIVALGWRLFSRFRGEG